VRVLGPIHTLLRRKYYFDELYDVLFVRPAYWLAETFSYKWIDRGVIDGILHGIGRFVMRVGDFLRKYIDLPVINGTADRFSEVVKGAGRSFRVVQTGRVQQYLIVGLLFTGALLSYLILANP